MPELVYIALEVSDQVPVSVVNLDGIFVPFDLVCSVQAEVLGVSDVLFRKIPIIASDDFVLDLVILGFDIVE